MSGDGAWRERSARPTRGVDVQLDAPDEHAIARGADLYLTGELPHHDALQVRLSEADRDPFTVR